MIISTSFSVHGEPIVIGLFDEGYLMNHDVAFFFAILSATAF